MTLHKELLCQEFLRRKRDSVYLEIGVRYGVSFDQIRARRKIGVDPVGRAYRPTSKTLSERFRQSRYVRSVRESILRITEHERIYALTSDEFFETRQHVLSARGIDVALIDGLHAYEQSLRDVLGRLAHLNPGGVIVLDDCNPASEQAGLPATSYEAVRALHPDCQTWQGDVWKTVVHLRSQFDDLEVCVLDAGWGIGVVRKGRPKDRLSFSPDHIKAMSYADLESDRASLLNLKPPGYFHELLASAGQSASEE